MPDATLPAERGPRFGWVTLETGIRMHYAEQGDAAGMPIILLHGYSDSWFSFSPVLPFIPQTWRVFALDLRGHGMTDKPTTGYGMDEMAADVVAFMDALGLESAVLVGHSMGRVIAQRFAIDEPQRTVGVVLLGAFAGEAENPVVVEVEEVVSTLTDPISPEFVREFQASTLAQPVPPTFLETVVQESLKVPAWIWRAAFEGIRQDDVVSELGKIRAPALVVTGDRDGLVSLDEVEAQTRAIPGARLTVYGGAGHGLHWEEPARFAADLTAFLASLGAPE